MWQNSFCHTASYKWTLITSVFHLASKPMTSLLMLCSYESLVTHHNVCVIMRRFQHHRMEKTAAAIAAAAFVCFKRNLPPVCHSKSPLLSTLIQPLIWAYSISTALWNSVLNTDKFSDHEIKYRCKSRQRHKTCTMYKHSASTIKRRAPGAALLLLESESQPKSVTNGLQTFKN